MMPSAFPRALARRSFEHPLRAFGMLAIVTLGLGSGVVRLDIRTDGAAIHPRGNATVARSQADRSFFGETDQLIVLARSRAGAPDLASLRGLRRLRALHEALAALPEIDAGRLRSLASLPDPRPFVPINRIGDFLDEVPDSEEERAALLERLRELPIGAGLFLSSDRRTAAFYAPIADGVEREAVVTRLEAWAAAQDDALVELQVTGPVAAEALLGRAVLSDLSWLVPLMIAVIAGMLMLTLGTPGGVLVPMAEVVMVLVWTLGAMGHLRVPVTLVTTILPVLLLTMAVTDEIHLLERLQARLAASRGSGAALRMRAAMEGAVGDVGRPIVLTSVTTAVAFLSFVSASMAPIRHFGLFAAAGILAAMLLSFGFVPALVATLPVRWFEPPSARPHIALRLPERLVARGGRLPALVGLVLVAACAPGVARLSVQDSWVDNFDPRSPLASAAREFDAAFWGAYRFDIVLKSRGETERYFQRPEGLRLIEDVARVARDAPHAGGVASLLVAFEAVARNLEKEGAVDLSSAGAVSALPVENLLRIAVLARAISARIDLDHYLDWPATTARLRLFVAGADYRRARAVREYLERELPPLLAGAPVDHHFSGDLPVAIEVVHSIVGNQLRSVGWTLAGVLLVLLLAFRSVSAASVALVPLLAALTALLGAMGWAGMSLGIATSMFTALALGVGVDFALHFVHAYDVERRSGRSHPEAVAATLGSSGRAIRWDATVLSLGFLVLTASALKPNHSLGVLLAAAMCVCYAATLLFLPALLAWRGAR